MTEPKKRSWFATYKGWHTDDDKLWREIYARTVATLLAAFIAYLLAIVALGADPAPLRLILLVAAVAAFLSSIWLLFRTLGAVVPRPDTFAAQSETHRRAYLLLHMVFYLASAAASLIFLALYREQPPLEYISHLGRVGAAGLLGVESCRVVYDQDVELRPGVS